MEIRGGVREEKYKDFTSRFAKAPGEVGEKEKSAKEQGRKTYSKCPA